MASSPAGRMLTRQLQQMQSDKDIPGISCGLADNNIFEWEVMLMISDDVKLYGGMALFLGIYGLKIVHWEPQLLMMNSGGFFRARLSFPTEYPHMPPKMKFESPVFHPNSK